MYGTREKRPRRTNECSRKREVWQGLGAEKIRNPSQLCTPMPEVVRKKSDCGGSCFRRARVAPNVGHFIVGQEARGSEEERRGVAVLVDVGPAVVRKLHYAWRGKCRQVVCAMRGAHGRVRVRCARDDVAAIKMCIRATKHDGILVRARYKNETKQTSSWWT